MVNRTASTYDNLDLNRKIRETGCRLCTAQAARMSNSISAINVPYSNDVKFVRYSRPLTNNSSSERSH